MAQTDLAVRIATILDASGLKKADKGIAKLQKSVRGLNLGFALSAAGATAFAKASVNAFIADEAAASKLSNTVKNLGIGFANPYITQYIGELEKMSKVADDELRPAFQTLIQQTGSLAASQSALSTAIEVSRGSGYSLSTVTNDLAQAYVGNLKGLKKYYLGLNTAALSAKSFTEIQAIMNNQFAGSSAAYLSTYSGQVGVLSLAWGNFQEAVGGTLLTLASFGDGENGPKLNLLAATLDKIGGAITLIGKGKEAIAGLFNLTGKNGLLSGFNPYRTPTTDKTDKVADPKDKYAAALAKLEKDRLRQNAAIVKAQKAATAEQKKQAALKKQGSIFDLEQINLVAALKGKLSDEDRKRVELQLSLLTGNTAEAQRLTYEIGIAQGLGEKLSRYLADLPGAKNPFEAWGPYLDVIEARIRALNATPPPVVSVPQPSNLPQTEYNSGTYVPSSGYVPPTNAAPVPSNMPDTQYNSGTYVPSSGYVGAQSVVVQIDGKTIADALLNQSMSGNNAYLNRRAGGFD